MIRRKTLFDGYDTRKKMVAVHHDWPALKTDEIIDALDELAPGWRRVRTTEIAGRVGRLANGTKYTSPDIDHELPGRISVRGWDITGAINRDDDEP